jgi:site-specific DNA-methyltransferase (adenine-specific)
LVDLIYLDPPFNSKRIYSAPIDSKAAGASFKDMWTWADIDESYLESMAINYPALASYIAQTGNLHSKAMMAYLTYMAQRIIEMHRILKETGSLYLHCDPMASHYLKHILDGVFGKNNFRNEIVWAYGGPSAATKNFPRKHDILLRYTKSDEHFFNKIFDKTPDYMLDRARKDIDGRIWVDQRLGKLSTETIEKMKQEERVFVTKTGELRRKQYLDEMEGVTITDVWNIPVINSQSKERTGYPTQIPLALLNRIIQASCPANGFVFDPFCGCATALVAAQQLGRHWIGIDIEKQAASLLVERLSDDAGLFSNFIATDKVPVRTDVIIEEPNQNIKERLYSEQEGKCNGCGEEFKIINLEVDHIIPRAKGGGNYYENYQLLCGNCNRTKGTRPMDYLRAKIKVRETMMKDKIIFGE